MMKYYYYCYRCDDGFGCCVGNYEGEFDIANAVKYLEIICKVKNVVIINWKEISSEQFKKLSDYYDKSQK